MNKIGRKNLLGTDPVTLKFQVPRSTYAWLEKLGRMTRRSPTLVARDILLTQESKERS